ncbi:hypothetical protein Ndes2437A_g08009 [Nannochloris sp. 'desiccata']
MYQSRPAATKDSSNLEMIGPLHPTFYIAREILAQSHEMGKKREKALEPHNPALATDQFRMYSFKIDACPHVGEPHDINECPYLHPGEKARRRDPRVFQYEALPCPDFRKSQCKRGDACPYGHGVFECWLHPSKYRTTLCKEGAACTRSVCFFAHSLEQLREPTAPAPYKNSTATTTAHSQHIQLPPIVTNRGASTLKALSLPSSCENNHPDSPGSILHQQSRSSSNSSSRSSHGSSTNDGHGAFSLSTTTTTLSLPSSVDTSRCASPGASTAAASTAAAAMENFRLASMSLPSSVDSSLASTPVLSEAIESGLGFCLPASIDIDSENLHLFNKHTSEDNGCSDDVAMAAAVALRAQQQQAVSAAAAAQEVLTRILQTAAVNGVTVSQPQAQLQMQCSSFSRLPPLYPSLSVTTSAVSAAVKKQNEQQNKAEFALQQLMAGLGL